MAEMTRQEILLESGTNEMEIIEFYLDGQPFGINVHKLREIIPYDPKAVTHLPDTADSLLGTLLLRGRTIPLIDLKAHIDVGRFSEVDEEARRVVLVCEFNNLTNGFLVDGVNQIHRVSWEQVQPMSIFLDQYQPRFTGSISIDKRDILIVDLEHIVAEIDPEAGMAYDEVQGASEVASPETRKQKKLLLAEDSAIIRMGIQKVLVASGYEQLQTFDNGQDCYEAIRAFRQAEQVADNVDLLISDIEMPRMDGLTLCRKIKEEMGLQNVKVIMFSSLINEQMEHKCELVGADGHVTKPQIPQLVTMIDGMLFK